MALFSRPQKQQRPRQPQPHAYVYTAPLFLDGRRVLEMDPALFAKLDAALRMDTTPQALGSDPRTMLSVSAATGFSVGLRRRRKEVTAVVTVLTTRELDFEERQTLYVSVAAELSDGWGARLEGRRIVDEHRTVGVFDDTFAFELVEEEPRPLLLATAAPG